MIGLQNLPTVQKNACSTNQKARKVFEHQWTRDETENADNLNKIAKETASMKEIFNGKPSNWWWTAILYVKHSTKPARVSNYPLRSTYRLVHPANNYATKHRCTRRFVLGRLSLVGCSSFWGYRWPEIGIICRSGSPASAPKVTVVALTGAHARQASHRADLLYWSLLTTCLRKGSVFGLSPRVGLLLLFLLDSSFS